MAGRFFIQRTTATLRRLSTLSQSVSPVIGNQKRENLSKKLSELKIRPSDADLKLVVDQWIGEGPIKRYDIINTINFFRNRKNYKVAIQLSDWLESSKLSLNNSDQAIRIDLIAKTRGIDSAENFFNGLDKSAKTQKTYGSLLNCYCKEKLMDKAMELFTKVKQLKCASTLDYNNVLALYMNSKQPEQVPMLFEEMKQNGVKPDLHSFNLLINSYAAQKDFDAMEQVLEDMKENGVSCDWFTHANVANIYINAGTRDKAVGFIQDMEKEMKNTHNPDYFHTLIDLYKELSDLPGVYRSWEALKSHIPTPKNTSHLILLLALFKLGDVVGLEKYYREWESSYTLYDIRLTNVLLESYLQRGMIEEANVLFDSIEEKGNAASLKTLNMLAWYHIKNSELGPALDYVNAGAPKVNPKRDKWFPTDEVIQLFLKYFEEQDDADGAEKFCSIMKKLDRLDPAVYASLISPQVSSEEVEA